MKTLEIDDETLARMVCFCGSDPGIAKNVSDVVLLERPDIWSLPNFLALIEAAVAKIPESARDRAMVELDGDYLEISYARQETAIEIAARVANALKYVQAEMRKERAEYERLKLKFAPPL